MNNPTQFKDLVYLSIAIRELQQEDLVILGRLPALHRLMLEVNHKDLGIVGRRFVFGAGLFPCLDRCFMWGFEGLLVFQQGALSRLREIYFEFHMPEVREITDNDVAFDLGLGNLLSLEKVNVWVCASKETTCSAGGFDLGLGNLLSLQEVAVFWAESGGASEEAKAALRHAAEIHPNRPLLVLSGR